MTGQPVSALGELSDAELATMIDVLEARAARG